jgi:hypothetical protein
VAAPLVVLSEYPLLALPFTDPFISLFAGLYDDEEEDDEDVPSGETLPTQPKKT